MEYSNKTEWESYYPKKINYDYQSIHNLVKFGSIKVKSTSFTPDLILAIGGGGFIPARILRTYIDVPIVSMTINFYNKNDQIQETPNIIQMVDKTILEGKNVLIVDEVDDTRKTLGHIIEYFNVHDYNIKQLGIFVVNNKIKEKVYNIPKNIYYYSCADTHDVWINYPWDNIN